MPRYRIGFTGAPAPTSVSPSTVRLKTDADAMMYGMVMARPGSAKVWRGKWLICRVPVQNVREVYISGLSTGPGV